MTTPFDTPMNPFADAAPAQQETPTPTPTPAPAAQQAVQPTQPADAVNPFADIAPQQPAPQQAPAQAQSPLAAAPQSAPPQFAAPQATFSPPQQGNFGGGGKRKYKIFDLYWIVNQKLYQQKQLDQGETAVLNISYNIDFDNLRLSFCVPAPSSFTATAMELKSMERKTTVNICAEVAEQLIDLLQVESGQINNLERVFQNNDNWAPNQTVFTKKDGMVVISTKTRNGEQYSFTLQEWQIRAMNHSCLFLLKEARILTLSKMGIG